MNSSKIMEILTLFMLIFALWTPGATRSATAKRSHWISCKECNRTAAKTINWRCRFGCDRYYSLSTPKPPVSIRKHTVVTGNTGTTSLYLPCSKCYGHGRPGQPTADPRCKFGCGRVITYPPEYHKKTTKQKPTSKKHLERIRMGEISKHVVTERVLKNTITEPSNAILFSEKITNLKKSEPFQYHYVIIVVGLGTILMGTLLGSLYYKHKQKRVKIATVSYAADNVVTNMYHE